MTGSNSTSDNVSTADYAELTEFRRDLLIVIAGMGESKGLEIKEEIEKYYEDSVHHGRLYPNLDTLADMGLVQKSAVDGRSNAYMVSPKGRELLRKRGQWLENRLSIEVTTSGRSKSKSATESSATHTQTELPDQGDSVTSRTSDEEIEDKNVDDILKEFLPE